MKKTFTVVAFGLLFFSAAAQDIALTDSLKQNLANATTPSAKVYWLGELANFYRNLNNDLSEKYYKEQLQIAELSRDRELMIKALFSHANGYYNSGGVQANLNRGKNYSQQALDLARSSHMDEYVAWAYIYLARGARNEGKNDESLNYSNLAVSMSSSLNNDSLKISALNNLGSTYQSRNENLLAFRNFVQALHLAETFGNYEQLRNCYYRMSSLYADLGDMEKSKDYLFKVITLTKRDKSKDHRWDRLELYRAIGNAYRQNKQYDLATQFYENAMKLSDTLNFPVYKLNIYGSIIDLYILSNQPEKADQYFREKKELRDFMANAGLSFFIHNAYGIIYTKVGKYDSAAYHMRMAEPGFESRASAFNRYYFYTNYAALYSKTGNHRKALEYWLKAKRIADDRGDLDIQKSVAQNMDSVYQQLGDYRNAYLSRNTFYQLKDSLQKLSTEKDLMLLEVDNENRRKELEARQAEERKRDLHNTQYMGITAGIAAVFIVLVMFGIFSVSKTTIRILGFFAFIFLFEFIILVADNMIHHWTHGEPLKVLAIKIGLISILLPFHHWLEAKVIHYLTTRKMLELNAKDLINKIAGKAEPSAH